MESPLAACDDVDGGENGEVLGGALLRNPEKLCEGGDIRAPSFPKFSEDAEAVPVGERLQELLQFFAVGRHGNNVS